MKNTVVKYLRAYAERKAPVNGIEYANGILAAACLVEQTYKWMEHDVADEICPYCGMILRGYEGCRICFCKFCGGQIKR